MAVEKIALGINLRMNKISTNAGYGKYYPEVDTQKTLSLRGFAQHMVDHGSIYGRSIVEGVLLQITDCLPELVAQGVPVQLEFAGYLLPHRRGGQGCRSVEHRSNGRTEPERHREGHPHPFPARFYQAGQPVRSAVQEPLLAGAA